jgi:peroxiredoxin
MSTTTYNRLRLLAILALFVLPLGLAGLMYSGKLPLFSNRTVNQGKLIQPPVLLDWAAADAANDDQHIDELKGGWVILLPLPEFCKQECRQKLTGLRQVHRASGREQQRIRLALLTASPLTEETQQEYLAMYAQFKLLSDRNGVLLPVLQTVAEQHQLNTTNITSYLVDPLGNIMMAYDMVDAETRMSKDLKRLLAWSKQDKG